MGGKLKHSNNNEGKTKKNGAHNSFEKYKGKPESRPLQMKKILAFDDE